MEFKLLSKSPIYRAFSDLGKKMFQPTGIFFWSGRAKKEAELNASIGEAVGPESDIIPGGRSVKVPYFLPQIKGYISMVPENLVGYAPINGVPKLRDLWEQWIIYKGTHGSNLPSGNIDVTGKITKPVITAGITQGIFYTVRMFLSPGETIISPNKRWENYNSIIEMQNGVKIESFQFFKGQVYNTEGMVAAMHKVAAKQDKVVLILNFPNNPTGYTPTPQETKEIVQACLKFADEVKKPLVLIIDDAYEGYVYTNSRITRSIFYELVDKHPMIIPIKLDGASKEMLMYGARVAAITLGVHHDWCTAKEFADFDKEWDNKTQAMNRATNSNGNHFGQEVLIEIMSKGFDKLLEEREKITSLLRKRYEITLEASKKITNKKVTMDASGGGFFVFLNVEGLDAEKLADHLLVKYKVGIIPLASKTDGFSGIRVAYVSMPDAQIPEAFNRINQGINDLLA